MEAQDQPPPARATISIFLSSASTPDLLLILWARLLRLPHRARDLPLQWKMWIQMDWGMRYLFRIATRRCGETSFERRVYMAGPKYGRPGNREKERPSFLHT